MSASGGLPLFIATLIAADALRDGDISAAADALAYVGCAPGDWAWIDRGSACDLPFEGNRRAARAALERLGGCDVIVQPTEGREKRLLVSDMDSTMIQVECIDELADYAGIKPEIGSITERAMAGELDFVTALVARVALLKGLPIETLARCYEERVRMMPGAETLVRTMRARGAQAVLVSGGFTEFADRVGGTLGFDKVVSNRLKVNGGKLEGTVERPVVGAEAKRAVLVETAAAMEVSISATLAVGDGANDIPMIETAGLGVAFRGKPAVEAAAHASIRAGDLTTLLWAQGIARRDWADTNSPTG